MGHHALQRDGFGISNRESVAKCNSLAETAPRESFPVTQTPMRAPELGRSNRARRDKVSTTLAQEWPARPDGENPPVCSILHWVQRGNATDDLTPVIDAGWTGLYCTWHIECLEGIRRQCFA